MDRMKMSAFAVAGASILLIAGCQSPSANQKLVEKDGFIEVEAEYYTDQQNDQVRKWVHLLLRAR